MAIRPEVHQLNLVMEARRLFNEGRHDEARETLGQVVPPPRDWDLPPLLRRVKDIPEASLESLLVEIENKVLPRHR